MNKVNIQGYADDIVLLAPTAVVLKVFLEQIGTRISDHELMIDVTKTKIVIFKALGRSLSAYVSFEYRGEQIEIVDKYKYLGINIQSDLMEKMDINRVTASFNKNVGMFLCSLVSCGTNI